MWNEGFERARARLHNRVMSYQATFLRGASVSDGAPWWAIWRKPKADEVAMAAEVVLRDLAHYCYAGKPTLKVSQVTQQTDPYAMAFAEGRRDVFNRITAMCNLNQTQIDRIVSQRRDDD